MKELLERLGNPLQASTVPTQIERVAHAQFGLVHSILKRRLMWSQDSLVLTYLKGNRLDSANLPLYCIVAEGAGFGSALEEEDVRERFLRPILNRFKGRAHIGVIGKEEDYAHFYQWGMWLEEDMIQRYYNQELPFFEDNVFDAFADFDFQTFLPLFAYDYGLLREKLEASAAAIQVTPKNETSFSISMPSVRKGSLYEPEPRRFSFVMQLLAQWNGQYKGFLRLTADSLLESHKITTPVQKARSLRQINWQMQPAASAYVQSHVMRGKPIQQATFAFTEDEAFAYFGAPHRRIYKNDKEIRMYYFQMGDALFLCEVADSQISVYHFHGELPSFISFEKFCEEISG